MKGNVLGFDPDSNTGAISGYDGRRYEFAMLDWHGRGRPRHGDLVDFIVDGNRAGQIYPAEPDYVAPSFSQFYLSAAGRVSRSQYWLRYFLPVFIIAIVLSLIALAIPPFKFVLHLFQLVMLWPGIAVLIKRIHDRNKSGWLVWALYGPLIVAIIFTIGLLIAFAAQARGAAAMLGTASGTLWLITAAIGIWFFVEFGCLRGTIGGNRYGPDPVVER